jgi:acyl dehydratase
LTTAAIGEGLRLDQVAVGDELPELAVELSTSLIVAGALASRDYTPVHHDRSAAAATGMQDVFMNILTTNGFVGRYVTDWAGRDAVIKRVAIRLGTPNLPGDTLKVTGKVAEKDDAQGVVVVEVAGKNSWGTHVSGRVTVGLPSGG